MVEVDQMDQVGQIAKEAALTAVDWTYYVILIAAILAILIMIVYAIMYQRKFKHTIVLRQKTKGNTDLVMIDKYYYLKEKGRPEKLKLKRLKETKPLPPEDAIDVNEKGLEYCEGYYHQTGEIRWLRASEKPDVIEFKAISTDDKEFYLNEAIHAAELYRNKKGILDLIMQNLPLIFVFLMFVMVIIFWEDITKPMVAVSQANADATTKISEAIGKLDQLINNRQVLQDDGGTANALPPG